METQGFWGKLFSRPREDDEAFERRLFDAARANDRHRLRLFCEEHADRIVKLVPTMRQPGLLLAPDRLRALRTISAVLQSDLGDLRLHKRYPWDRHMPRWEAQYDEARAHAEAMRFGEAVELLSALRQELRGSPHEDAPELGMLLELTAGLLGELLFESGRANDAIPLLLETRARCAQVGEHETVARYESILIEALRYLGRGAAASKWRLSLAETLDACGKHEQAARQRALARRFPDGEPPLRALIRVGEDRRLVELDEAAAMPLDTRVECLVVWGWPTLPRARALIAEGRRASEQGDEEAALELFRQAADEDRRDPESRCLAGGALLSLGRAAEAIAPLEESVALAPGFMQAGPHLSLARRIARGELPAVVFQRIQHLEELAQSPRALGERARAAIDETPRVAQLHKHLGNALLALGSEEEARAAFTDALAVVGDDAQTRWSILAQLAARDDGQERAQILADILAARDADPMVKALATILARSENDESLKRRLYDAVAAKDRDRLRRICEEHTDRIVKLVDAIREPRPGLMLDREQLHAVRTIGAVLADDLGDLRLHERYPWDRHMQRWEAQYDEAMTYLEPLRFEEAIELLSKTWEEIREAPYQDERAVELGKLAELTTGYLGQFLYMSGRAEEALPFLLETRASCARWDDLPSVAAYESFLVDAHRYLGRGAEASRWRLAHAATLEALGKHDAAARERATAARFPDGEPPLRVMFQVGDDRRLLEADEAPRLSPDRLMHGVAVLGWRQLLRATQLIAEGRRLSAVEGDKQAALDLFLRAAQYDPRDPESRYLVGGALLWLKRAAEAIAPLEEAVRLAPDYMDALAHLLLARRIARGEVPDDVFVKMLCLEDLYPQPELRAELAAEAIREAPNVAQLHGHRASALVSLRRKTEARAAFTDALDVVGDDHHTRASLLLQLATCTEGPERAQLLASISEDPRASLMTRSAAALVARRDLQH
jgi:tetratricopeptide (TPR) repeat protein